MSRRVFVFGIDGASLDFILPRIKEGHLKNFKKLLEGGCWGPLRSTFIANSASAWTTFITGKNPGKHGIYDFFKVDEYIPRCVYFSDVEDKPFWDILSEKGKKSYIVNVPLTYPPKIENGVIISGLQTPLDRKDFIFPEDFWEEVKKVSPDYKVFPDANPKIELKQHIREIDAVLKAQLDLVDYIFKKKPWDLLVYVAQNTDTLQHYLWNYIDKTHSRYKYDGFFSDALSRLYDKLDSFLGRIIDSIDDDTSLMLLSDHGAGKVEKHFFINNWLLENKYLFLKDKLSIRLKRLLMKFGICDADLHNIFVPWREKRARVFYKMKDVDWNRTLAYGMNVNQLFINLKGREARGIVEPSADFDGIRDAVIEGLMKIKHPYKNRPLMDRIYKKEEIFFGEKLFQLPDLVFICDDFEIISPGGYKISSSRLFDNISWTGDHRLHGILCCYGNGMRKGFRINDANIEDIPPTIIALLGNMLPEDFDGKVLEDIFSGDDLKKIRKEKIATKKTEKGRVCTEDEKIKGILESLGYM